MRYIPAPTHGRKRYWAIGLGATISLSAQAMDGDTPLAEALFFSDVPVVLSATRLDQPLTDTPRSSLVSTGARAISV